MPAAAVIPAPIAYIKVVAVKKLVVGSWVAARGPSRDEYSCAETSLLGWCVCSLLSVHATGDVYFEEIRVFKAGALA